MNDVEKIIIKSLKERKLLYTAKYIEMFGIDDMCPSFRTLDDRAEHFYKDCVKEGHPWDWYFEFPETAIF